MKSTATSQVRTVRTVPVMPSVPIVAARMPRTTAMMTARIVNRAPHTNTHQCCFSRWKIRSPLESNPSA